MLLLLIGNLLWNGLGNLFIGDKRGWKYGFLNWIMLAAAFVTDGVSLILFFAYCGYRGYAYLHEAEQGAREAPDATATTGMPPQLQPSGVPRGRNPERAKGEGLPQPRWVKTSPPLDLMGNSEGAEAERPHHALLSPQGSLHESSRGFAPGWKTFVLVFVGIPLAVCLLLQVTGIGVKEKAQDASGLGAQPVRTSQAPTTPPADAQKDEWVAAVPKITVSTATGLWVVSRDRPRDEPAIGKEVEVLVDEGGIAYIGVPLEQADLAGWATAGRLLLTPETLNQLFPESFLLIEGIDAATFGTRVQRDPSDQTVRVVRAICTASVPVAVFSEVGMLPVEYDNYQPACKYIGDIPQSGRPGNSEMAWSAVPHSESPLRTVTGVVLEATPFLEERKGLASIGSSGGSFSIKSSSGDVAEFSLYSSPSEPPTPWKVLPGPSDVGKPFEVTYRDINYTGAIKSSCNKRIVSVRALNADVHASTPSVPVFMGRSVQITTSPVDDEGSALKPATICLASPQGQQCYTPPAKSDLPLFGLRPEARAVRLKPGYEGLLFTAEAWGGKSWSLHLLALLEPGAGSSLENLLPPGLWVTEQGEYRFWDEPSISDTALIVVADYVFTDGDTHFSAHRFRICSYVFSSELRHYELRDEYITSKKYPSLDEVDGITVLEQEKPEVLGRLQDGRTSSSKSQVASSTPPLQQADSGSARKREQYSSAANGGTDTGEGNTGKGGEFALAEGGSHGDGIYRVGGDVSMPVPIYKPEPSYSEEARSAKHQGIVVLWIVVDAQGNVADARVVRPLGLGLDEKAIEAVRTWRFKPALRNGSPVPVRASVEVTFRLFSTTVSSPGL